MRIGLVLSSYPGYSETFFRNKIIGLQADGHEVILFLDEFSKAQRSTAICKVYALNLKGQLRVFNALFLMLRLTLVPRRVTRFWKLQSDLSTSQKFRNLLLSAHILHQKLDWLHFGFLTSSLGRELLGKVMTTKLSASIRGFDISIYPLKNPGCYDLIWTHLSKLHTISDDLTQKAKEAGLPNNIPTIKITPAIDTALFDSTVKTFENIQSWQLITVARLHWKKGLIHTLEALQILKHSVPNFVWHVIGDGPELEQILFTNHDLGLHGHVILHGKLSPEQVRKKLADAHIYLQYSVQEGFCNAVLEAQAMGLVSLVSNAEGLSENIEDQKTGFVIPKRDPLGLCAAIQFVMEKSPNELSHISEQAKRRVKEKFNLEQQRVLFHKFYTESI